MDICGKCGCEWEDQREESDRKGKGGKKGGSNMSIVMYLCKGMCHYICSEKIKMEKRKYFQLPPSMEVSHYFNNFHIQTEAYGQNVSPGQVPTS